jgi:hypothetical protein
VADARFRTAIASALARETTMLERYRDELLAHSPYAEVPYSAIDDGDPAGMAEAPSAR